MGGIDIQAQTPILIRSSLVCFLERELNLKLFPSVPSTFYILILFVCQLNYTVLGHLSSFDLLRFNRLLLSSLRFDFRDRFR
jgi:hypothetical protein